MKGKIRAAMIFSVLVLLLSACGSTSAKQQTGGWKHGSEGKQTSGEGQETAQVQTSGAKQTAEAQQQPVSLLSVDSGSYFDYYWDETLECTLASLKYPYMHLSDEYRTLYPELEKSVVNLMNERKKSCTELYSGAIEEARPIFEENPGYTVASEVSESATVRRADTRVLSLLLTGYLYKGGTHGMPYNRGFVFDTRTGRQLKLTDIVTDVNLLPELVEKQLDICWGMEMLYEDLDLKEYFTGNQDEIQWVLDYNGITFFFNPYEIAPYASGMQDVLISFEDHPELFRKEYMDVPSEYGVEISLSDNFYYDVDGNGLPDSIRIDAALGEYEGDTPQVIMINDIRYEEDEGIYQIEPMLMHMEDGRNYLYIEKQYPDDFRVYSVYNISGGFVEKADMIYAGRRSIVYEGEMYPARRVLTDPKEFTLDTMTQVLGTAYGYDSYHVGSDGMPVQDHEVKLKKGDRVVYYRTDGSYQADLRLQDGSLVRVCINHEDGEWTINGIALEEVFDGVMFGG